MSEVEVTDFETVEITETRYECDRCGAVVGEDDIATAAYWDGPDISTHAVHTQFGDSGKIKPEDAVRQEHLCESCSNVGGAIRADTLEARWRGITTATARFTHWSAYALSFLFGAGTMLLTGVIGTTSPENSAYFITDPLVTSVAAGIIFFLWTFVLWFIFETPGGDE